MAGILQTAKILQLDEQEKNFSAWKFRVQPTLKAEVLHQVIESGERKNETQRIIVTSVDEKIIPKFISCKTARDVCTGINELRLKIV